MIDPGATDQEAVERRARLSEEQLWAEIDPWEQTKPLEQVEWNGGMLHVGDRVRLAPKHRADIFDMALVGKVAVVQALEQDFEDQLHVAVVVEEDPGMDLGNARMPGHRFFYKLHEIAPLDPDPVSEGS